MININERVITIKEKSIYELVMADTLDPQEGKAKPPVQRAHQIIGPRFERPSGCPHLFDGKGSVSEGSLPATTDVNRALLDMLDVVRELAAMETEIEEYIVEDDKARKRMKSEGGCPGLCYQLYRTR